MNFTGKLNYAGESKGDPPQLGIPTIIHDARAEHGVEDSPRDSTDLLLNGNGFLLVHAPSAVQDWSDPKEVARIYYDEMHSLVQKMLPEFDVSPITSHTFRNEEIKTHHWIEGTQYGPPAEFVHNDYADSLAPDGSVEKTFPEIMDMPSDRRVIGVNLWRSVTDMPLERFPLAVCDRTSIEQKDLVYEPNLNAPKPFNAHYCRPNSGQHWNYYSQMIKNEALIFTTYDSTPDDGHLFKPTLHTAVRMPGSDGKTPRVSIEVRFFAFQSTTRD
ncbi:MAG: CmcJ/NvfI family oxidoreductase [Pseudomonadota bacterium]